MSFLIRDASLDLFVVHRAIGHKRGISEGLGHLSTASRIDSAGDDAAGLAISDRLRVRADGLGRAAQNLQEALSVVQIAEGGFTDLTDILQRMHVLAVEAANDTYDNGQRALLQYEIDELVEEIDRQVETVRYNSKAILDGTYAETGNPLFIQVGSGAGDTIRIAIRSLSSASLGVDVLAGNGITTRAAASSAMTLIATAVGTVVDARATLGAVSRRLEETLRFVGITREDQTEARSTIKDLDYADGITDLARVQTLEQGALASIARLSTPREAVLALL